MCSLSALQSAERGGFPYRRLWVWPGTRRDVTYHRTQLLDGHFPAKRYKALCKSKIYEYWHSHLVIQCVNLPSLRYLQPCFLSLSRPHPILANLSGNPYESRSCHVQIMLLSGRYRTEKLRHHWSINKDGFCLLPGCKHLKLIETEEHLLLHCPALVSVRRQLFSRILEFSADKTELQTLLSNLFFQLDDAIKMQFLLDPSTLPAVISAFQTHGDEILAQCFKIGRMWCRSLHDSRLKLMD